MWGKHGRERLRPDELLQDRLSPEGIQESIRVADESETLKRLGAARESLRRLTRKAAEAEATLGIHGVSVTAGVPTGPASTADREAVEKQFRVHNTPTRADPLHRTVELPKPPAEEAIARFNDLFGRS